jgi:hypothetical protein
MADDGRGGLEAEQSMAPVAPNGGSRSSSGTAMAPRGDVTVARRG